MIKYLAIFLLACVISLSSFLYWNNYNYKKIIEKKDKEIVSLKEEKTKLATELEQTRNSLDRYKFNLKVCYSNIAKQQKLIETYQLEIEKLNQLYLETRNELEQTIEHYELKLDEIKKNADSMVLPDNTTEKVLLINHAIDLLLKRTNER